MLGGAPGMADEIGIPAKPTPGETDGATPPTTPDPAAAAATPGATAGSPATPDAAADPLAGAQPFTYGDGKTLEGVHVIPGEGALIPEANLHVLRSLAEQRDALDQSSQQYADQVQDFERLTTFEVEGHDGQPVRLSGVDGITELRASVARTFAENEAYKAVLADPQKILALIARDGDKFVLNPDAVEAMKLRINVAARDADDAVRSFMSQHARPRAERPAPSRAEPSSPAAREALSAQAPRIIEAAAKQSGLDFKLLTDTDKAFLAAQIHRYERKVTEQDRRFNPALKIGQPIVDAEFANVVKDRIGLRQEAAAAAKASAKAAAENAPKLAAAAPVKPVAAPAAPATPAKPKLSDDHINFRRQEAASMGKRYDPETDKIV